MTELLKPCPFCGEEKIEVLQDALGCWYCACINCFEHFEKEDAIKAWNKRVNEQSGNSG